MTNEVPYPESHPHAQKLRELKDKIDEKYRESDGHTEKAREHYKLAQENLRDMSTEMKASHDSLKEIVKLMRELEAVVVSPLF
jgi:hypothetical protein